jgi:glycosyltransferase involved in cell wall biosynthesis
VTRISIIIPARNEAAQIGATIRAAIAAVEAFDGDAEIILVDNGSTDDTVVRAAAVANIRVVHCSDPGAGRARNVGAAAAEGAILVFVDADTRIEPASLSRIARHVASGFAAGIFRLSPQAPAGLRPKLWWLFWNNVRRLPLPRAKALPAFMFCTRDAFERFGPFDETVAIGEEWPILAGLYRADPRRLIYDRTLTAHTSSRRMELQPFGYTRTYFKYFMAILMHWPRVRYSDTVRERAGV